MSFLSNRGSVLTGNTYSTPLLIGETFTGTATDMLPYSSLVVACKTDQNGMLYIDFSVDGTNWDSNLPFTVTANVNEVHRISVTRKYFRIRLMNTSGVDQTFLRLQSLGGSQNLLTSTLSSTIQNDADAVITRSVLMGQTDGGVYVNVPSTSEGHIEVAIHDPILPFGSVHTESLTPVFQSDGVYGINSGLVTAEVSLSGVATTDDSSFSVSTGVTIYSQSVIQSRKRLRYRAGQGVVGRFAGYFTSPVSYSYQLAGLGHSEDGAYFGYAEIAGLTPEFGVFYVNRGVREVQTLTVTTGATSAGNLVITLNSVVFNVPVTASSNIQRTVYEIANFEYAGWSAYPSGATVVFISGSSGNKAGSFTFSAGGLGAVASITETRAGVASTDLFIPQSEWNGDVMDGTGSTSNPSGYNLDPTKGNVYQIGIQYLGYGSVTFKIESTTDDGNNSGFQTVHVLKFPNTRTKTSFGNPSFPFTVAVYSAGSTTNLSVKIGSFGGFIEGGKYLHGNRFSYYNQLTTVGSVNYQALMTIMNSMSYGGRANQAVINIQSIAGALKHTSPCIYYLIKNGTLSGNPNFTPYATNSCSLLDISATTVSFTTNDQIVWSGHLGDTGELDHDFIGSGFEELTIQPGEMYTLAAKSTTGNPSYVTGSINTREDQ